MNYKKQILDIIQSIVDTEFKLDAVSEDIKNCVMGDKESLVSKEIMYEDEIESLYKQLDHLVETLSYSRYQQGLGFGLKMQDVLIKQVSEVYNDNKEFLKKQGYEL